MGLLTNAKASNVGTSEVIVYTVPTGKTGILIGANIANKVQSSIKADIILKSGATNYYLLKGVCIPPTGGYSFSGFEQKIVLSAGEKVVLQMDTANSADVWVSISELVE